MRGSIGPADLRKPKVKEEGPEWICKPGFVPGPANRLG